MDEYNLDGILMMNPDKSNNSTVQKHHKTLYRRVNRQRCTTHGHLLLENVLPRQIE